MGKDGIKKDGMSWTTLGWIKKDGVWFCLLAFAFIRMRFCCLDEPS
jgi:hypothetical protein